MEEINYDIMRYELDEFGYVLNVYFGCSSGTCVGYTGEIPEGYETLCEWSENANIRAYKVVDGNLVYDAEHDKKLQEQYKKEAEDNRCVKYKEIKNITNIINKDVYEMYLTSTSSISNLVEVIDSNKFASLFIRMVANESITGSVKIKFNNANLLPNDATSKTVSGISFTQNDDRAITIEGTATEDIEYAIAGTDTSTEQILTLKKNINYYLSSNNHQIKMFNYDGTERAEIYSGKGGVINFTDDDKTVTQVILSIKKGEVVNTTIFPMLNEGTTAEKYVTYESNYATIDLQEYEFSKGDIIEIDNGFVNLIKRIYPSNTLYPGSTIFPGGTVYHLDSIEMPITYLEKTYMYSMEDTTIQVTYPNIVKDIKYEGTSSDSGKFGVDEEGRMYCSEATINGGNIILKDGSQIVGDDGLLTFMTLYGNVVGNQYGGISFDFIPFGMTFNPNKAKWEENQIVFNLTLPNNFVVQQANMILEHIPTNYTYQDSSNVSHTGTGYARNIELFVGEGLDVAERYLNWDYTTGQAFTITNLTKIDGAFGPNGFTGTIGGHTKTTSIDLASYINNGIETLVVKSAEAIPSGDWYTGLPTASEKTGACKCTLLVYGFFKTE